MAGYTVTARDDALDGIISANVNRKYLSLHTADPGTTGASEVAGGTYARVATTWSAAATGIKAGSQVTINVPASTTIQYWGLWDAASAGNFVTGGALPANETYGSAGTYLLTPELTD